MNFVSYEMFDNGLCMGYNTKMYMNQTRTISYYIGKVRIAGS